LAKPNLVLKEATPTLRMEVYMYNPKTTLIRIRHVLTLAQYIFSLILLALEIYERLQYLHLI